MAYNPTFYLLNKVNLNGYLYSRSITILAANVGASDSTNFPVLFSGTYSYLAVVASGGFVTNSNGYDIIFTSDSTGSTKLDHEIESYVSTTGAVNFWVRVPTVSHTTNTVIYLWYGNPSVTTSQENIAGTWNTNYKGVWHVPNGVFLSNKNSVTGNTGTTTGASGTTGQIDGGALFGAASTDVITTDLTSYTPTTLTTMEAWAYRTGEGGGNLGRIFHFNGTWQQLYNANGSFSFIASWSGVQGSWGVAGPSLNSWHHLVATYDAGSTSNDPILYIDGVAQTLTADVNPTGTWGPPATTLYIGNRGENPNRVWQGTLDELRLSNSIRSADWVLASYNNQNSPSSFYTIGPQS